MPGIDERMTRDLERLAEPPEADRAFDEVFAKKARRRILRRLEVTTLVVFVLAGTAAGTYGLTKVFRTPTTSHRRPGTEPPGNGRIAFVHASETTFREAIYTVEPDGTGLTRLTDESRGYETPAWSPDGSRIAFSMTSPHPTTSANESTGYDIYVMNADGIGLTRLTHDGADNVDAAWSPDGSKIAFTSNRDGAVQIFAMNADGTGVARLTQGDGASSSPAWSPDGSRIALYTNNGGANAMYVMNADGTDPRDVSAGVVTQQAPFVTSPAWSPDGKKIAFVLLRFDEGKNAPGKNYEIYAMNADGTGAVDLTNTPEAGESDPVWSPDGTKIAFRRNNQIFVMNADGTHVTQITTDGDNREPSWQPLLASTTPIPSSQPTPAPSETSSPVSVPTLPASCDPSTVMGDFDGDGSPDTATVRADPCLQSASAQPKGYSLSVEWGNGASGSVALGECQARQDNLAPGCRALAASDLNGDGRDELVLQLENGPAFWSEIYELAPTEAFGQQPVTVAPPGAAGFPAGESFVVLATPGFGVAALTCETAGPLNPGHPLTTTPQQNRIVVGYADISTDHTTWQIKETVFVLDPNLNAPWGQVSVVSTDTRTAPVDPSGGGPKFAGHTCPGMEPS